MKTKKFNEVKPYCYVLTRLSDNKKYHGVRWANVKNGHTPIQDFGKKYFTSHKILKRKFKKFPKNFKFKLTFTFSSIKEAQNYEVHKNKNIIKNSNWINIQAYPAIINKVAPNKGVPMSKETKKKVSLAKKGKKLNIDPETRKRLSDLRRGNTYSVGKKRSKIFKEKLRLANIGKKLSKTHKTKIGKSNKGKEISKKQRKKISKTLKSLNLTAWNKGKPMSMKAKTKLSLSLKRKNKKLTKKERKAKFGHPGWKHSPEAIAKIKAASTGRKHSKKTKINLSKKHKGKKIPLEVRLKIAKTLRGRKYPDGYNKSN